MVKIYRFLTKIIVYLFFHAIFHKSDLIYIAKIWLAVKLSFFKNRNRFHLFSPQIIVQFSFYRVFGNTDRKQVLPVCRQVRAAGPLYIWVGPDAPLHLPAAPVPVGRGARAPPTLSRRNTLPHHRLRLVPIWVRHA